MATEMQIAANRANAKRSTGPKTAAGKQRSSGNAFRHGLSGPLPADALTTAAIEGIARAVVAGADFAPEEAIAFATSQLELRRIREVRKDLLMDLAPRELRRLAALDRYERVALTKNRRARRSLAKPAHNQVQAT